MQRLSGKSFDVTLGDLKIHIEKASLDIEDGSEVAKTGGVPNGWVDGEVSASGEIELDGENVKILSEAARNAAPSAASRNSTSCFTAPPGTARR